jgi:hypothetical protein
VSTFPVTCIRKFAGLSEQTRLKDSRRMGEDWSCLSNSQVFSFMLTEVVVVDLSAADFTGDLSHYGFHIATYFSIYGLRSGLA